jgi:GT2 family glycosyltransferase
MPLQRDSWGAAPLLSGVDTMSASVASAVTTTLDLDIPLEPRPAVSQWVRPTLRGKFLWVGEEKFYIRGVTYGPFRPHADGHTYPSPRGVARDFALIAASGMNAIRTYNAPPRWLLDCAQEHGLRVMVGLQAERHFAFLEDKKALGDIRKQVSAGARACSGHPAVLSYTVANEIPAHIVRWHGARKVERFIENLFCLTKDQDPESLFCYANYPTTEYLDLQFLDLVCFNVFLESRPRFEAYLARLQNLAGNRPLIMTEIGLDSMRNGEAAQAATLDWQIRSAFAAGCAGAFVYSWTDEWYNQGQDVKDWKFGLTDQDRKPKTALTAVSRAFADTPFEPGMRWPRASVVVCTFNGSRTIRQCLEGLEKLRYPDYEVIVIDDGSTDGAGEIALQYNVRVIRTKNRGLSHARNLGLAAATGEIIAYLDDDASPDPDWLSYLALTFQRTNVAGVGGPNIPFPDDGQVAACIAHAPGGPTHVLLSDEEAEHIPGCNMAFRRDRLQSIGGFDSQFRVAGDDVDVCWRIQEAGGRLGFSPAAMVLHHCRNTVRAFWKQQVGYGRAEAMVERKWPEKYNSAGQIAWGGRIYSDGLLRSMQCVRGRIYQGTWGTAFYTRLYSPPPGLLHALPVLPEWVLLNLVLAGLSAMGFLWPRLLVALPLLILGLVVGLFAVGLRISSIRFSSCPETCFARARLRLLTAFLHLLQPLARFWGRLRYEFALWRDRRKSGLAFPRRRGFRLWNERGQSSIERLQTIESTLREAAAVVRRGGDYDGWDLEVGSGVFGNVRLRLVSEEYGSGKQLVRLRGYPRFSFLGCVLASSLAVLAWAASSDHAWAASGILGALALAVGGLTFQAVGSATAAVCRALKKLGFEEAR